MSCMNLNKEWSIEIAEACAKSETLIGVHLSDNGIRYNQDWAEEIVDRFGLSAEKVWPQQEHGHNFTFNMRTLDPQMLRELVIDTMIALDKKAINEVISKEANSVAYQRHIIVSK